MGSVLFSSGKPLANIAKGEVFDAQIECLNVLGSESKWMITRRDPTGALEDESFFVVLIKKPDAAQGTISQ